MLQITGAAETQHSEAIEFEFIRTKKLVILKKITKEFSLVNVWLMSSYYFHKCTSYKEGKWLQGFKNSQGRFGILTVCSCITSQTFNDPKKYFI